jgi:hypothetical protein
MHEPGPDRRVGFPSLYNFSYSHWDDLKNLGFDYGEELLKKSMSKYMFKNPHLRTFLIHYLQPIMVKYINSVKFLRIYFNFAVPKWYQKIN